MKLNNVNRFQVNPVDTDQPRSRIGRSYSRTQTFLTGQLVPIYVKEVLPNETLKLDMSSVVRSITPAVPVMDNAFIDYFFFFVPNRLCTANKDDWQKICGENTSGFWAPSSTSTLANTGNTVDIKSLISDTIGAVSYKIAPQSLLNFLGAPVLPVSRVGTGSTNTTGVINTLAPRAYYKIWDEWFRDENTQAPFNYNSLNLGQRSSVLSVNKFHDLFTSSLQSPQKGASVVLPLGSIAPVITNEFEHDKGSVSNPAYPLTWRYTNGNSVNTSLDYSNDTQYIGIAGAQFPDVGVVSGTNVITDTIGGSSVGIHPTNLWADLSAATAASVNELRNAFAIQRLLEKDARGGSRYFETLLAHFGVSNPDLVLQRPEYLAGKRVPLNISQVLQTSETSGVSPLGTTGAFSNTSQSDYMFTKSFGEYGFVMGLACVRTSQSYSQGIPKFMLRNERFDFYWRSLANIGEQPILKKELFFGNSSSDNEAVFGYQEAWAHYRYQFNQVLGYFNPDANDTSLSAWTYTNKFNTYPTLNSAFNVQPRSQFDDTLVVTNASYHFIANFFYEERLDLPMPLYSIPGLIDHH